MHASMEGDNTRRGSENVKHQTFLAYLGISVMPRDALSGVRQTDLKNAFPLLTLGWRSVRRRIFQTSSLTGSDAAQRGVPAEPVAFAVLAPLSGSNKPLKEILVTQLSSCIGQVVEGPSCQLGGLSYAC